MVKFRDLEPDTAALNHAGKIGQELIPDALYPEDDHPSNLPPRDDSGVDSGGGSLEGA